MLSVTVSDATGLVAYKGRTNAAGVFATGKLQPGDYVVQFNSSDATSGTYALALSAGKQKVTAEAVPGAKFAKGGVAMKVKVGPEMNITGQVWTGKAGTVLANAGNTKVRIINGRRYVWLATQTGSNLGGRWVEEGTPEAQYVERMSRQGIDDLQARDLRAPKLPAGGGR